MADVKSYLDTQTEAVTELLCDLIRIPSVAGDEKPVAEYLLERLSGLADVVEAQPVTEDIKNDPDYSFPVKDLEYGDRPNVHIIKQGKGTGSKVLFNTHQDVVPPSRQHKRPFDPYIEDGAIYGRGACDAKGQIATLVMLLQLLNDLDIELPGDIEIHFVIEEEVGGNGTVAAVRTNPMGDFAVNMEPSNFTIYPQIRGAVWFEVTTYGQAGHSGAQSGVVSALYKAIEVIDAFKDYHARMLEESRGKYPLFDVHPNPAPLTIGQLESGDWPAQVPQTAVFKGLIGVLPDRTKEQVMEELHEAIRSTDDEWLAEHYDIEFTYRHDASVIEPEHDLVKRMARANEACGVESAVSAMTSSSDAWWYTNQLRIPTVWWGPGDLGVAHSNREHIVIADVLKAVEVLVKFLGRM